MARVAVQFVASSNMSAAVVKDLAAINAQLGTMAAGMAAIPANGSGMKDMVKGFRDNVNAIQGYNSAAMQARTVTSRLTDDINRQRASMKDVAKLRANDGKLLNELTQQQLRLKNATGLITHTDMKGNVFGELIQQTNDVGTASERAAMKAGLMGKAMESAGIQTLNAGKRMQWTGRQITTTVSMPIMAALGATAYAAYTIDKEMTRMEKVYGDLGGVSEKEMARVKEATMDTAMSIAKNYGIAAKETVGLAADFAAAGYQGEEMQQAIKETTRIAVLGELDRQKAMQATITLQTVYGKSGRELATEFDFLNAIEGQTNTTLQDLTEVIPRTANVINELGGSVRDSALYTVAFKEAGIDAVQGANALRSSLAAITAPSGVAQKKLNGLGIDIRRIASENVGDLTGMLQALGQEMEGLSTLEKQEALATLFGRYQYNKMSGLLKALTEDVNDTSTQTGKAYELMSASAEDLANNSDKELKKIQESLSNRLKQAGATIVAVFAEVGRPVLHFFTIVAEIVAKVVEVFGALPKVITTSVLLLAGLFALAGPALMFYGIFKAITGQVMKFFGANKAAKAGVTELMTAETAFAKIASMTVTPAILAEAGAAEKLAIQMGIAAAAVQRLSTANSTLATGAGAAAVATAGGPLPTKRTRVRAKRNKGADNDKPDTKATGAAGAADDVADKTDDAAKSAGRLRGAWSGIATTIGIATAGMLMFGGATDGAMSTIMNMSLLLLMFPGVLRGIGKLAAGAFKAVVPASAKGKLSSLGRAFGKTGNIMNKVKNMANAARLAMVGFGAPLAAVGIGITAVVVGYKLWKKHQQEQIKDAVALQNAAGSLANIVGFKYATAVGKANKEGEAQKKTAAQLADEWKKGGKEAERAAKEIEELYDKDPKKAIEKAKEIGLDARAHGATAEQAQQTARIALASTGNYSDKELDLLPELQLSNFASEADALAAELQKTGYRFSESLKKGADKGSKEDTLLQDMGKKVAARLDGEDKPEIMAQIDGLMAEVNRRGSEALNGMDWTDKSKESFKDFGLMDSGGKFKDIDVMRKWFKDELPKLREAGKISYEEDLQLGALEHQLDNAAQAEMRLVDSIKEELKINGKANKDIDTMAELRKELVGETIHADEAQRQWEESVAASTAAGSNLNEEQKLAILNIYRLKAGLAPAIESTQGFGEASEGAKAKVDALNKVIEEGRGPASEYASRMRTKLAANVQDAIGELMDQFDAQTEKEKEAMDEGVKIWEEGWEKRKEASDDAFEAQEKALDKTWDAREKAMDKRQEKELSDAETVKEKRIEAVEKEMDAADKLDEKREQMFQAEMTRIQRLAASANTNIDFNVALRTGNLDEAARISEGAYVTSVENAQEDASATLGSNADARRTAGEAKIAGITTTEDKRISGISDRHEKEKEAFQASRDLAKQALQDARDNANARFEAEKESYQKTADAAKKRYETERAERRKVTETLLEQEAIEIPRTEQGMKDLLDRLQGKWEEQTGQAFKQTKAWTDNHRTGFITAMEETRKELRNEAAWAQTGRLSVDAMTQGMLGMSFEQFATWMATGKMPEPEVVKMPKPANFKGSQTNWEALVYSHGGGPVGKDGGRAGRPRNAPLYPDEVPTVLQKGEYVLDKHTVSNIGLDKVQALHKARGQTSFFHDGGLVGAVGASIMQKAMPAMQTAIVQGAQRKAAMMMQAGQAVQIPPALAAMVGGAVLQAGKYGDNNLDATQLKNANTIVAVGRSMGATDKDLVVALMTALQESGLRNLASAKQPLSMQVPNEGTAAGDADSVGLFQQRTSQGWGSIAELMTPSTSARKFFEQLLQVKNRQGMSHAEAAQAVQRSANGSLYAKWQNEAEAIISGMNAAGAGGGATPGYKGGGTFKAFGGTVTGDIQGLQQEFLNRLARWSAAVGEPYKVGSGYRSMAEQAVLYARYIAGVPGQAKAAPPGRSNHNFGLASDGPHWGGRNPGAFGLTYPMSYEPWHVEPIGAKGMRVPQLAVGGHVNYDNTIANLHKNETVLTAPLSDKLARGIDALDSGATNQYNITVNGAGADAETVANKVMQKIQRMEQIKGPKRVIR